MWQIMKPHLKVWRHVCSVCSWRIFSTRGTLKGATHYHSAEVFFSPEELLPNDQMIDYCRVIDGLWKMLTKIVVFTSTQLFFFCGKQIALWTTAIALKSKTMQPFLFWWWFNLTNFVLPSWLSRLKPCMKRLPCMAEFQLNFNWILKHSLRKSMNKM